MLKELWISLLQVELSVYDATHMPSCVATHTEQKSRLCHDQNVDPQWLQIKALNNLGRNLTNAWVTNLCMQCCTWLLTPKNTAWTLEGCYCGVKDMLALLVSLTMLHV